MSTTRVTPQRVIDGTLLPSTPLGEAPSTASPAAGNQPAGKATPDLKSDVFAGAKAPAQELGAKPADAAQAAKRVTAELKKLFENEFHTLVDRYRARFEGVIKKRDFGWDPDAQEAKAKKAIAKITADPSRSQDAMLADFQALAGQFINSMNDYHVSIGLNRTSAARLPFRVRPIAGTYVISSIDREKLPESDFPFEKGDELVEIDGKPVKEVIAENLEHLPHSNAKADDAEAATILTVLRGSSAEPMPKNPTCTLTIRRADGSVASHNLAWDITPERLRAKPVGNGMLGIRAAEPKWQPRQLDMTAHRFIDAEALAKTDKTKDADPFLMSGRKTLLPDLGPIIYRTDAKNPFDAYVYRTPNGKTVGVIRIPSFGPDAPEKAVAAFAELIKKFEDTTDALVIDQNNNPGGYFNYMMALLSMLSPEPMKMPNHHEKITIKEAADADEQLERLKDIKTDAQARKALGKSIVGFPVSLDVVEKLRAHSRHIKAQFDAGKDFTDGFPLDGIGTLNPSTDVTYTKPILCLVNATCYSCGDFFPAALKTNKRAIIMGETTAGAGGYVIEEKWINRVGIDYVSITGSVADLSDKDPTRIEDPLEGRGVKPDLDYSPTLRDMREEGADMRDAVNTVVEKMVEASAAA